MATTPPGQQRGWAVVVSHELLQRPSGSLGLPTREAPGWPAGVCTDMSALHPSKGMAPSR